MSKFSIIGVLCCLGGFLILGFQAIASVMTPNSSWENLTLVGLFPPELLDAIDNMSEGLMYSATDYIITLPLYILLFSVGTVMLILSSFMWRK